jgi:CRP/FNR family cyclic AMP-dependent transcriptional regulator
LLKPILAAGVERQYEDGETIMRVGEPGDFMSLVLEGTVRVERPGKTIRLQTGDVVGEIAVLDGGPRSADVIAEDAVRCLEVQRQQVLAALEADPRAATALIAVLAGRFRERD